MRIFRDFSVDTDNNGEIDANELVSALSNGTWIPFNLQTVKLMISMHHSNLLGILAFLQVNLFEFYAFKNMIFIEMFDRRGSETIRLEEFGALWKYVQVR